MRKPDVEVQEVTCSETHKPMPKIPLWMAGMKVKFVSDEARQKHPSPLGITELEPIRKSIVGVEDLDEIKEFSDSDALADADAGFEELEADVEEEALDEDI